MTAKKSGGEVGAIFRTQEILAHSLGITNYAHLQRLEQLAKFVTIKCLISDARSSSLFIPSLQLRAIAQHPASPWSSFTYGDKHAIVVTKDSVEFTYIVMKSVDIAQTAWKEFTALWNNAFPLVAPSNSQKNSTSI